MSPNTNMIAKLAEQLKRHEGLRLKLYKCSAGKNTIGVGHNLDDNGISESISEMLLIEDIANAEKALNAALGWTRQLDEARRCVLLNMVFNIGIGRLMGFKKMIAAVQGGQWSVAAAEMRASKWAVQVGKRADELAWQMELGTWKS